MEKLEFISPMQQESSIPFKWTGHIYSVSEITYLLKDMVETQFPIVCVRGEVSNISRPSSGHIYFSLKDERALLSVVWFRSNHDLSPGRIAENLSRKMEVLCIGKMSIYPPSGSHQLIAEYVVDVGIGTYYLQLEALKERLQKKGYFSQDRKRPIKRNPSRVAVITSPSGAAIKDFLKIVREKALPCEIRIYPSSVQGEVAEEELVSMIEEANKDAWAEVLIIIRGGGSLEDLMVFNSEKIANAIFNSSIPVVTGIGHEIDTTIADMTADYRCATPTHVANFLWEGKEYSLQALDEMEERLVFSMSKKLEEIEASLSGLTSHLKLLSPLAQLQSMEEEWKYLKERITQSMWRVVHTSQEAVKTTAKTLLTFKAHPLFQKKSYRVKLLGTRFIHNMTQTTDILSHQLVSLGEVLKGLDPYLPLKRGYSILFKEDKIIKGIDEVSEGDKIDIELMDGILSAEVKKKEEKI